MTSKWNFIKNSESDTDRIRAQVKAECKGKGMTRAEIERAVYNRMQGKTQAK